MTIDDLAPNPDLADGTANFDAIYNGHDPRAYFVELGRLDYEIPHHGQGVFAAVLAARRRKSGGAEPVLDLCCSYGVNAALMTTDLTMADIAQHYRSPEVSRLGAEEMAVLDEGYYARHRIDDPPTVAGLDISPRAIDYARRVGLLAHGSVENLEESPPSPPLADVVASTGVITVTGGVGYITARTYGHLYDACGESVPWLAAFALRRFSFHDIADVLAERGLVTERLMGRTFPQRRFASDEERDFTLRHLDEAGLDIAGREADGRFHTDFYLSRPAAEVAERPLSELLGEPNIVAAGGPWRL